MTNLGSLPVFHASDGCPELTTATAIDRVSAAGRLQMIDPGLPVADTFHMNREFHTPWNQRLVPQTPMKDVNLAKMEKNGSWPRIG